MNRILVVDDAATVRMYHRKLLGDAGWHIEEASNGVDALEMLHAQDEDKSFDLCPDAAAASAPGHPASRIEFF